MDPSLTIDPFMFTDPYSNEGLDMIQHLPARLETIGDYLIQGNYLSSNNSFTEHDSTQRSPSYADSQTMLPTPTSPSSATQDIHTRSLNYSQRSLSRPQSRLRRNQSHISPPSSYVAQPSPRYPNRRHSFPIVPQQVQAQQVQAQQVQTQQHIQTQAQTEQIQPAPPSTVAISTSFYPGSHPIPHDIVLASTDSVYFYVHSRTLLAPSPSAFQGILPLPLSLTQKDALFSIPESSDVLNVILHTLYSTSPAQQSPTFQVLCKAVERMPFYNLSPQSLLPPSSPLYILLLSHAPLYPLPLYILASKFGLHPLAQSTSAHLLCYPLFTITDEEASDMGALYLKKLLTLHFERSIGLKKILLKPPYPHPPTKECGFEQQKKLTRAWALVAAYLAWDARPDVTTHSMQNALNPLLEHLICHRCHRALADRIRDVVVQWASIDRTI